MSTAGAINTRLKGVVKKDKKRNFTELERRIVFYREKGICQVCGNEVRWEDAEVDHVEPHASGGPTMLPNARLVHGTTCHSRGKRAIR